MELSPRDLQEILRVFADSELRDLHIEVGELKLVVSKDGNVLPTEPPSAPRRAAVADMEPLAQPPSATTPPVPQVAAPGPEADRTGLIEVTSPAVGVFYRRPAPDQPSYVEVGDPVEPSSPVCTIEVMKMFTEVLAGCHGTVVEVCAENEQLVEHGQVLMYVRPPAGPV